MPFEYIRIALLRLREYLHFDQEHCIYYYIPSIQILQKMESKLYEYNLLFYYNQQAILLITRILTF